MSEELELPGEVGSALAAEVIGRFGTLCLRVTGGSMAPAVRPSDTLRVHACGIGQVEKGEIVVFLRAGRLVVHRVSASFVESGQPKLLTRGDRNLKFDAPVASCELLGRVGSIRRGDKTIEPKRERSFSQKITSLLLSCSNRATSLYLRFAPR